jgi:catechol 2,3-dioxygenase-like lactoylglutathione lyase family enzyme
MMAIEIGEMTPLIQVFNMRRALVFYRDILGFKLVSDSGNGDESSWVWLRLNNSDLMLNDQYEPGHVPPVPPAPPEERTRWQRDTCLYFDCPDPDTAYEYRHEQEFGMHIFTPHSGKQLIGRSGLLCFAHA